ncbi:OB-fold-containig protein [Luteimonas sp. FCS-9]|uniref:OB-fold-containig protein n=1 Tax=Luteimonas sp. FCS-9 TaxID=1547516 RepID=UPI00063E9063|nr:OB-fold-containig protein [Luteimonas sp. FCS-9]KLI98858.1 hypothetical protein WQ56_14040 [Luteimonas sp. FCS-9]
MPEFVATALGYPTLVYSVLLGVCAIYWLLAALGLVDIGGIDLDVDLDLPDGADAHGLAGVLGRLGLDRLPLMLVLTLVVFFGWFCTYFVHLFLLPPSWGWLRWTLGTLVAVLALVPAALLTTVALRPLRRWLLTLQPAEPPSLLGRVAVVRTPTVSATAGMADVDDGGAGLVLQVRADGAHVLNRGERVVLVEFDAAGHCYRVVPEADYRHI